MGTGLLNPSGYTVDIQTRDLPWACFTKTCCNGTIAYLARNTLHYGLTDQCLLNRSPYNQILRPQQVFATQPVVSASLLRVEAKFGTDLSALIVTFETVVDKE